MSAAAEKGLDAAFRYARHRCLICGKRIQQKGQGRPRLICPSRACERKRHLQLRPLAWTLEDVDEAKAAFRFACAFCGRGDLALRRSRYHAAPVPVCVHCAEPEAQLRAPAESLRRVSYFVGNAKRGCPLPRPYLKHPGG
jgi:hypothetical protein